MADKRKESGPTGRVEHLTDRELSSRLMRHQAGLGMRVAAVFLVLVLGLPLLTQFWPAISTHRALGFPVAWLVLGLLFYPITWILSAYFVKASEKLEAEGAQMVREERNR